MSCSLAMPGLPGAHHICVTCGDWASFQTMACSLPPEPRTRSFMSQRVSESIAAFARDESRTELSYIGPCLAQHAVNAALQRCNHVTPQPGNTEQIGQSALRERVELGGSALADAQEKAGPKILMLQQRAFER